MNPTHHGDEKHQRILAVVLLVSIGVSLLAHPVYLWPKYDQTQYVLTDTERVMEEDVTEGNVVEYAALPSEAQEAFDAGHRNGFSHLWSGEDDHAINVLKEHRYVRYQEGYYRYEFHHVDDYGLFTGPVRGLLTAMGAFLVVLGGLLRYSGSWRPLTPLRSLLVPAGVMLGIVATHAYDVLYSGASGSLPLPEPFILFIPTSMVLLSAGSVVEKRGIRTLLPMSGSGIALLVGGAIAANAHPIVPLNLGIILAIGGAPWFALGFILTDSEEPIRKRADSNRSEL